MPRVIPMKSMKEPKDISQELLLKYLSGTASEKENREVREWMSLAPENRDYIDHLQSLWANAQSYSLLDSIDLEENWQAVQSKLGKRTTYRKQLFWKIAATLVFFLTAAFLIKTFLYRPLEWQEFEASEQTTLTLPDGSLVALKAGSQLVYPTQFGDERRVKLKGEAFFEVEHNQETPFVVEADQTETRVLGTSFNLRTAAEFSRLELVLVEGKVSFTSPLEKVVLEPGQRVSLGAGGLLEKTTNTNPNFQAWKTGRLVFENTPMSKVFQDIANAYNTRFELSNEAFGNCTLTARYDQEGLENILRTLEILFNLSFEDKQGTYMVSGGSCQ